MVKTITAKVLAIILLVPLPAPGGSFGVAAGTTVPGAAGLPAAAGTPLVIGATAWGSVWPSLLQFSSAELSSKQAGRGKREAKVAPTEGRWRRQLNLLTLLCNGFRYVISRIFLRFLDFT